MIIVRPTINLYYDQILDGIPVPNGVSKYKINKQYFNIPVMSSVEQEKNDQVLKTTYFYNVMKVCDVNVNLFTGKESAQNLFYPLELTHNSSKILITSIIPEKSLSRIKKKKMKLLILYQQWIGDYKLIKQLKDRVDTVIRYGIPIEQIYVVLGDVNCSYQELFKKIKIFGIDWWQIAYQLRYKTRYLGEDYHWVSFSSEDLNCLEPDKELIDINNWNEPEFLFTAFTGSPTTQSVAILSELKINSLIERGRYEFNTQKNGDINLNSKIFTEHNPSQEYRTLKKQIILDLMNKVEKIDDVKKCLENSVFSIISEPFSPRSNKEYLSETNAMWISPNVWKLIALGHPFIAVGSLSLMRYLNNEGYFSYVDMFKEKYDSVSNLAIKVDLIVKEIEKISKLSKEEVKEIINLTKPFVEVNKKKFLEKKHTWKFYDLFTEMQYE
jgi:hypothetical protein